MKENVYVAIKEVGNDVVDDVISQCIENKNEEENRKAASELQRAEGVQTRSRPQPSEKVESSLSLRPPPPRLQLPAPKLQLPVQHQHIKTI